MSTQTRFLTKYELAELLGVKVSYVEEKTRTQQWPSCLFAELRFSPQHIEQIIAMHERPAKQPEPAATPATPRPRARRAAVPAVPAPAAGVARLRARPERSTRGRTA